MYTNPESTSVEAAAARAGLGRPQARYTPRPARILVPLVAVGVIYLLFTMLIAGAGFITHGFGFIMFVLFTAFIGLGVANLLYTKRKSAAGDELVLFERGLVVKGPKTLVSTFRWEDAKAYQRLFHYPATGLTTYNYLLVDPAGNAISIGDPKGAATSAVANVGDLDKFTLGAAFDRPDLWGPVLQEAITAAQLPRVLAEIDAGGRAVFGELSLDRHGITAGGTVIPWGDLQQASLKDGVASFKTSGRFLRTREPVYMIPNFFVFKAAVQHRSGLAWT